MKSLITNNKTILIQTRLIQIAKFRSRSCTETFSVLLKNRFWTEILIFTQCHVISAKCVPSGHLAFFHFHSGPKPVAEVPCSCKSNALWGWIPLWVPYNLRYKSNYSIGIPGKNPDFCISGNRIFDLSPEFRKTCF